MSMAQQEAQLLKEAVRSRQTKAIEKAEARARYERNKKERQQMEEQAAEARQKALEAKGEEVAAARKRMAQEKEIAWEKEKREKQEAEDRAAAEAARREKLLEDRKRKRDEQEAAAGGTFEWQEPKVLRVRKEWREAWLDEDDQRCEELAQQFHVEGDHHSDVCVAVSHMMLGKFSEASDLLKMVVASLDDEADAPLKGFALLLLAQERMQAQDAPAAQKLLERALGLREFGECISVAKRAHRIMYQIFFGPHPALALKEAQWILAHVEEDTPEQSEALVMCARNLQRMGSSLGEQHARKALRVAEISRIMRLLQVAAHTLSWILEQNSPSGSRNEILQLYDDYMLRVDRMNGDTSKLKQLIADSPVLSQPKLREVAESLNLENVLWALDAQCLHCKDYFAKTMRCGACKKVYYCSRDCQRKDYAEHKADCKKVTG